MKDLVIYGAGGLGREVALLIEQINERSRKWKVRGFYDDRLGVGTVVDGHRVLGTVNQLNTAKGSMAVVVAVADSALRRAIVSRISNKSVEYPVIAHPQANLGASINRFGRGCIVTAGCILTTGIELGEFVIINLAATIGHDVKIGSFASLMPECSISGNVRIGNGTLIGTGARILQNLTIGDNCKVGAGAVVTKNIKRESKVVGVPAHPLKRK